MYYSGKLFTQVQDVRQGLIADWPMNEGNGTTIFDKAGANNGTINGATWVGNQLKFDGVNDIIDCGAASLVVTNNFTFSFWFKSGALGQVNKYILNKDAGKHSIIYGYVANSIEFFSGSYSGANPRTSSTISIPDLNWHHIIYSYDGGVMNRYKDNILIGSVPIVFSLAIWAPSLIIGGASLTVANTNGFLSDIRVYNRALTPTEATNLYNFQKQQYP